MAKQKQAELPLPHSLIVNNDAPAPPKTTPAPSKTTPSTLSPNQIAIQRFKEQIAMYEKQTLPSLLAKHGLTPEQFTNIVLSEIKKDEKLLQAFIENPSSMFASILAGAEIGLIPSNMVGEFYLIPRNLKGSDGKYRQTVTPLIGYKGLVSIILRGGDITKVHAEVVYEGDDFAPIYGLEPTIIHKPNFDVPRTADKIKYVYAVAKMKSGEYQFVVMTRKEIEAVRDIAKYTNDLYFNDKMGINRWMEKKTALIQLSKMLPKDYYSKKAIGMDGMIEGGAVLTLDENNQVKIIEGTPVKPTRYRNIYGTLNAPSEQSTDTVGENVEAD